MTKPTHDDAPTPQALGLPGPVPDPRRPAQFLTERELIARAEYCDEIAHTGSPTDRAGALRDLDATWDEAERRAVGHSATSVPAQVAGYIGLIREDYDHALAAETAIWRGQLDAALGPDELVVDRERRVPAPVEEAAGQIGPSAATGVDRSTGDWDLAAGIAERDGYVVFDPTSPGGFRALAADERAALIGNVSAGRPYPGSASEHEAYLDSRPDETTPYNPAAEYGDPDWREPASDAEAAARTTWLAENTPAAPGWSLPPTTEVDDALDAAAERVVLSDRAHDHDPVAWAEYQRLTALSELAPLPDEPDALDRHQNDETAPVGEHESSIDVEGRRRSSVDAWVASRADPAEAADTSDPDDLSRLRQRLADLQAQQGDAADGDQEAQQRREQLARWHDDDHRTSDTSTTGSWTRSIDEGDGDAGAGERR